MNRIISQASFIGILMLAVVMGAAAQSSQHYRADIPFGFEAGGKQYEAGKYSVGPLSQGSQGAVAIRNMQNGTMRILGIAQLQGDGNWDDAGRLTFLKVGGSYTLSQISTATFKMDVKSKKVKGQELARRASTSESVAIDLHR